MAACTYSTIKAKGEEYIQAYRQHRFVVLLLNLLHNSCFCFSTLGKPNEKSWVYSSPFFFFVTNSLRMSYVATTPLLLEMFFFSFETAYELWLVNYGPNMVSQCTYSCSNTSLVTCVNNKYTFLHSRLFSGLIVIDAVNIIGVLSDPVPIYTDIYTQLHKVERSEYVCLEVWLSFSLLIKSFWRLFIPRENTNVYL